MSLRWLFSKKVRQVSDLFEHVRKLRDAQADILSATALDAINKALQNTEAALKSGADDAILAKSATDLENTANKWLKPYPNAEMRDNIEVFLVAIVVAMAIRSFFLQPFKIPTSSMQPTLYGVTVDALYEPGFQMPGFFTRVYRFLVQGAIYHEFIAPKDGAIVDFGQAQKFLFFFHKQVVTVRYDDGSTGSLTVWLAPNPDDDNGATLEQRIGTSQPLRFHKGDPMLRFAETTGDHLFVDRMTYNFRHPERGEIIVFKTKGIPGLVQTQFFIKRLVGLPGESISIGWDRHVRINGVRLDASTPHFANVYTFDPKFDPKTMPPPHTLLKDNFYNGHTLYPGTRLESPTDILTVATNGYVVFGDNTATSLDSRFWGSVPEQNIIGRAFFIYWPIQSLAPEGNLPTTSRFGWGQR